MTSNICQKTTGKDLAEFMAAHSIAADAIGQFGLGSYDVLVLVEEMCVLRALHERTTTLH